MWLTGLPAAGKTTLAAALADVLGRRAVILDGDELRRTISRDLGFDRASRDEQVTRAATRALEIARSGHVAVVALVSPYEAARAEARRRHDRAGVPFVLVHVATPLHVCRARDPKGLYARSARGDLAGLTGVDAPYEPPVDAEMVVRGRGDTAAEARAVLRVLWSTAGGAERATGAASR